MTSISAKEFKGLYTNIDQNKLPLEYQSEVLNAVLKSGNIETNVLTVTETPIPQGVLDLAAGFSLESVTFATIGQDRQNKQFNSNESSSVIVYIYRRQDTKDRFRFILQEGASVTALWKESSAYQYLALQDFEFPLMPRQASQKVYSLNEDGCLKLVTPYMAYEVSSMSRRVYRSGTMTADLVEGYYIYRLSTDYFMRNEGLSFTVERTTDYYSQEQSKTEFTIGTVERVNTTLWHIPLTLGESSYKISLRLQEIDEIDYYDTENHPIYRAIAYLEAALYDDSVTPAIESSLDGIIEVQLNGASFADIGYPPYMCRYYNDNGEQYPIPNDVMDAWGNEVNALIGTGIKFYRTGSITGSSMAPTPIDFAKRRNYQFIVTGIIQGMDEVVLARRYGLAYTLGASPDNGYLKFTLTTGDALSRAITQIRVYQKYAKQESAGWVNGMDYEQIYTADIVADPITPRGSSPYIFGIEDKSPNGIYLVQTLGYFYDDTSYNENKKLETYDFLNSVNGLTFAGTKTQLYRSITGSGIVQKNSFHRSTVVPIAGVNVIRSLNRLGNSIAIATQKDLVIMDFTDIQGELLASKKDTLPIVIEDRDDIVETGSDLIILCQRGIVVTNGYDMKTISEPINDRVLHATANSKKLLYDRYNNCLYLILESDTVSTLYRYDFTYEFWSAFNLSIAQGQKFALSADGKIISYKADSYSAEVGLSQGEGRVSWQTRDFGASTLFKTVTRFHLEYEGDLALSYNGKDYTPNNEGDIFIPLNLMRLHKKVPLIELNGTFTLKSIEVFFDTTGELIV